LLQGEIDFHDFQIRPKPGTNQRAPNRRPTAWP
jgi:hypothetical protein